MSLHGDSFVSEMRAVLVQDKDSNDKVAGPLQFSDEKTYSPPSSSHTSPRLTPITIGLTPVSGSPAQSTCQDEVEDGSSPATTFNIPIVGYEIMEERARFTVYKLRVENRLTGDCWYVYRRYTDFVRLLCKLKNDFPDVKLSLPKKRWFRDNFDSRFLESRIQGLQAFVNTVLLSNHLCASTAVKDFFCLNEPPSYTESMEESRVIFEVLEETVFHLRCQVQERDMHIEQLKKEQEILFNFIRMTTKECPRCFKDFVNMDNLTPPFGSASIPVAGSAVGSTLTSGTTTTSTTAFTSAASTTSVSAVTSTFSVTPISSPTFSSLLAITSTPISAAPPTLISATTSTPVSAVPSTPVSAVPSTPVSAVTSTPVSAVPSTPVSAVPSTPVSAVPSTPVSAVPSTPVSAVPSTPVSAVPSTPVSAVPSTPVSAVPSTPVSAAPSSPASVALSTSITTTAPTPISVASPTSVLTAISVSIPTPTLATPSTSVSNKDIVPETGGSIMSTQLVSPAKEPS